MAKRKKQKSIFEIALQENWGFAFAIGTVALVVTIFIFPSVSNPVLGTLAKILKPIGALFSIVFYLIAVLRFLQRDKTKRDTVFEIRNEPSPFSKEFDTVFLKPQNVKQAQAIEKPITWTLKLIQDLEWKRFEELSVAYYLEKGIRAETTALGADGGIDIKLYQDDSGKPTTIIQCKAWGTNVGVKQIREFLGVMTHEKIVKGFYMTCSEYTNEAKEFARANKITLINGVMLLKMIERLNADSQQRLLALTIKGDYKTPTCPKCGIKMTRRTGKKGDFWGCLNYSRGCRQMLNLRKTDRTFTQV
ncbi:MAG: hypothetical protein CVU27_04410 [Betaproteobacteria bacterium HGW-Betaproteobacteria-20]|jgi:restriction system protein|nr:MAG: hypothetical protein CVU27_04410 [Betaproteobacteria bacterium HGW-Betaproteobacteria-20]